MTHRYDVTLTNGNLEASKLKALFDSGSTLIFKEGNYYYKYTGGLMEFDIDRREDNKMFSRSEATILFFGMIVVCQEIKLKDFYLMPKKKMCSA